MEKQTPWHRDNRKVAPFVALMVAATGASAVLFREFSWYVLPILLVAVAATLWGVYRISANSKAQKNA